MKKLLGVLIAVMLMAGVVILIPHNVKAGTDGVFTYEVINGEATITDCDKSVSDSLVIPSTLGGYPVTKIGDQAFNYCNNLRGVVIPDSVINIGRYSFYYCRNLSSISIPDSVTSIGKSAFDYTAYYNNTSNWENDILYIGNYLIAVDTTISGICVIKSGTKCIADSAFYWRDSLTSVSIPDSVTGIGEAVFERCLSLTEITVDENNTSYKTNNGVLFTKDGSVLICYPCAKVSNLYVIPEGVESINDSSFSYSSGLTSVEIPAGVTSIGANAFSYSSGLTSISIPDSVTSIGDGAFYNCSALTSIKLSPNLTSIGHSAFGCCTNLESISIPNGITRIESDTFWDCRSLTSIVIPNGVTEIGTSAFWGCKQLTSISIPNSVRRIGVEAFSYCSSLKTVYYEGTENRWNKISIDICNDELLAAEIVFLNIKSELETVLDGTDLGVGILANSTEVVIVPTASGDIAMTEGELAAMLGDDITIVSNNGVIGTGSKLIIGEQEVYVAVKGDIDGDGITTVFDALMVKKAMVENSFGENGDIREFAGDIDGAGITDTSDVDAVLSHIVGEALIA